MSFEAVPVRYTQISKDDIIIAIMGPTGSGKSNFIDVATCAPPEKCRAGSTLGSCTQKIQALRLKDHNRYGSRLVLVDTPGFDDDRRSDMEVLELIGEWLKKTYEAHITLAGVIYMHRITDNRMSGTPCRNLHVFGELCGDKAIEKVKLVTTMWDRVSPELGKRREDELVTRYWTKMMVHNASHDRFDNSERSAWRIIRDFVRHEELRRVLLLQEELVDLNKHISETSAGIALCSGLLQLLEKQKQALGSLHTQQDPLLAEAEEAKARTEAKIEKYFHQLSALKIPFSRKVGSFWKPPCADDQ